MSSRIDEYDQTIDELAVKQIENNAIMKTINSKLDRLHDDNVMTNLSFTELAAKLDALKDENVMINTSLSELQTKVESLNDDNLKPGSFSELPTIMESRKVAFSAVLTESTPELAAGSTIVFDGVVYQTGTHYNPLNGIFTCPISGVYLLTITICNSGESSVQPQLLVAILVVDRINRALVVADTRHQFQAAQGSDTIIIYLEKGQQVWVHTSKEFGAKKVFKNYSSFSGALLYT